MTYPPTISDFTDRLLSGIRSGAELAPDVHQVARRGIRLILSRRGDPERIERYVESIWKEFVEEAKRDRTITCENVLSRLQQKARTMQIPESYGRKPDAAAVAVVVKRLRSLDKRTLHAVQSYYEGNGSAESVAAGFGIQGDRFRRQLLALAEVVKGPVIRTAAS